MTLPMPQAPDRADASFSRPDKRPYASPRLAVYGDIRAITLGTAPEATMTDAAGMDKGLNKTGL